MSSINELKWQTLTAAVNQIKSPNQFLKKRFFSNHDPVSTEDIEISVFTAGREVAPFVKKNGEAILVSGHGETFQTVTAPNIRIKRPFTPSELLFQRRPGTVIFPSADQQVSALQAHIARDLQYMANLVTNAEEILCSMALQGLITYSVANGDTFQITIPKPGANNITLSTFWNNADPTLPTPEEDFNTVKRVVNDAIGLGITDAVFGLEAASAFRAIIKKQYLTSLNQVVKVGSIDLQQQYTDDGVIYMGNIFGLDCWEYGRTAVYNGTATSMIRSKYVEFLSISPAAERVLYYGAIPDMKALEGRLFQGERFSKSWEIEDPSVLMALLHSRPLPIPRQPAANVSMKVVSG